MIYRCRTCGREEGRGCLPEVSCGLYLLFLLLLSSIGVGLLIPILFGGRDAAGRGDRSWWIGAVVFIASTIASVFGVVVKPASELVEYLAFAWRKCPGCGARRWSWGFTRGFGL